MAFTEAKPCRQCKHYFPKPKRATKKEWAKQECCSLKCAGILRERRKKCDISG